MRHELTDHEWATIKPMLPNKPRGVPRVKRPPNPKWHLLGLALRRTVARSAADVRPLHHLLQSLCSWRRVDRVEPDHERSGCYS